ncbi:GDP-mannose mannosyl hydrolase [Alteromonas sp. 14N.309.X.WAT.G.H12]|uniref:GDP-mannose mannosyl hydrolase n=1 Tax=Alteromonas sp. 14N.309.X.WAT.G.H12 TaxID=3120824 RepID=UPI002FD6E0E0
MTFLSQQDFTTVIAGTPLVSIDLIVENSDGEVLLGYRTNRPAKDYWFVPGGRILKNEKMDDAFLRLTKTELGRQIPRSKGQFLGVFEHLYDDCVFDEGIATHYVVLGYKLILDIGLQALPQEQHNEYRWFSVAEMLASDTVHKHTKWYVQ